MRPDLAGERLTTRRDEETTRDNCRAAIFAATDPGGQNDRPTIRMSEDRRALFPTPGSALLALSDSRMGVSRAGEGAPAFANFIPPFRRGRRNEHTRLRALPGIS